MKRYRVLLACSTAVFLCLLAAVFVTYHRYLMMYKEAHRWFPQRGTVLYPPVMPYDGVHALMIELTIAAGAVFLWLLAIMGITAGLRWRLSLLLPAVTVLPAAWLFALNHTLDLYSKFLSARADVSNVPLFVGPWTVDCGLWILISTGLLIAVIATFTLFIVRPVTFSHRRPSRSVLIGTFVIFLAGFAAALLLYRHVLIQSDVHGWVAVGPFTTSAIFSRRYPATFTSDFTLAFFAITVLAALLFLSLTGRTIGLSKRKRATAAFVALAGLPAVWLMAVVRCVSSQFVGYPWLEPLGPDPNVEAIRQGYHLWFVVAIVLSAVIVSAYIYTCRNLRIQQNLHAYARYTL